MSRLPRGRHHLTREEVEAAQRLRLAVGMAEAVRHKGYASTPVADVLKAAGVSRETFYELYTDKLACFLDATDLVGAVLLERLAAEDRSDADPLDRVERALRAYVELLGNEPGFARLLLIEVFAAGPEALARRAALQGRVVDHLARTLGVSGPARTALETVVAALGAMVAMPVVEEDWKALDAVHRKVVGLVRELAASGLVPTHAQSAAAGSK